MDASFCRHDGVVGRGGAARSPFHRRAKERSGSSFQRKLESICRATKLTSRDCCAPGSTSSGRAGCAHRGRHRRCAGSTQVRRGPIPRRFGGGP
jgi:hypothetical protein